MMNDPGDHISDLSRSHLPPMEAMEVADRGENGGIAPFTVPHAAKGYANPDPRAEREQKPSDTGFSGFQAGKTMGTRRQCR